MNRGFEQFSLHFVRAPIMHHYEHTPGFPLSEPRRETLSADIESDFDIAPSRWQVRDNNVDIYRAKSKSDASRDERKKHFIFFSAVVCRKYLILLCM